MPTFSNIDGEESSTVTFTVAAVALTRNSSAELQEILCLGDPDVASSLGLARVTPSAPASTNAALNVRIVSGPSTLTDFAVRALLPSTAADNQVTVTPASTVWAVQLTQYSTTAQVSSVAGIVKVGPHDTNYASSAGFHFDSTGQVLAAPLKASTSARASLTQSSTSVTAQSANAARLQWTCHNNPTQQADLFLKFGATASTTDYDVRLKPLEYYEMPLPIYTGRIDAIWKSTGAGFARTAEWLA